MSEPTARVVSIVYTPQNVEVRRPQERYARVAVERVALREFQGIDGDRKGGTGDRQLNVMCAELVAELGAEGFKAAPGELGEQIVIAGIDPVALAEGARLRLGSAVIEVTDQPHLGCAKFSSRFGLEALRFVNSDVGRRLRLRGMNARVVVPGTVGQGDAVRKLSMEETAIAAPPAVPMAATAPLPS